MANEVKLKLAIEGGKVVGAEIDGVNTKLDKLDGSARAAATGAGQLGSALGALATVGTALALIKMADSVTTLRTQLNLSTDGAASAAKAYTALFDIAQQGRVSFTELGTTFAAVSRAGKELGVSQDRLLTVTRSISQAMTIGGGSAASMQAALVQLGQGLSSGVLRGQELNSIMEQTPRLAKAIADGLGVPVGKLRELGETGQLTAEQVISALEKSGPALAKEMGSATLTVGQAFTMLSNSTVKFVGEADTASGASTTLAGALQSVSKAVDTVGSTINNNQTAFGILSGGLGGVAVAAGLVATASAIGKIRLAVSALGVAMAANPIILALAGIAAAGGAIISLADSYGKSADAMRGKLTALDDEIQKINNAQVNNRGDAEFKAGLAKRKALLEAQRDALNQKVALLDAGDKADDSYNANETRRLTVMGTVKKKAAQDQLAVDALLQKQSKVPDSYLKDMAEIMRLHESGALVGDQYNKVMAKQQEILLKATEPQKAHKASVDETAKALKRAHEEQTERMRLGRQASIDAGQAVQDENEAYQKAHDKVIDSLNRSADAVGNQVQKLQDEEAALAISADQHISLAQAIEQVEINRLQEARTMAVIANDDIAAKTIQREIDLRREAMGLIGNKEGRDASAKAADAMAADQKKAAEESGKYWEDALMRAFESGKGFFESLWDTIKNTLKTQVLKVFIQGVGIGSMGMSGAAMAGQGSTGGNLLGTAGSLSGLYDSITGGFTKVSSGASSAFGTLARSSIGQSMGMSSGEAIVGNNASAYVAPQMTSGSLAASSAIGTAAGYAAGAAAGLAIGNAITGEFGSSNTVTAGVIIGSIVGGPIGGAIGGAIGGLVNRAFGMGNTELTAQGTRGTFNNTGFSGTNYANYHQEGGWFRSDKNWTDTSAVDPKTVKSWSDSFTGMQVAVATTASSLGLATEKIYTYSKAIDIAAGSTAEQVTALFTGMADDMATAAAPGIEALAKTGETSSVTLQRLSTSITTTNAWLSMLRNRLYDVSMAGADAASKLADAFGGLDNLAASSKAYYEAYYSEAERTTRSSQDLAKSMALVNVALPVSKDAFRAVVSSLDLTTEAGRNAYAVMLALAPEYAATADAIARMAKETATQLMVTFTGNGQLVPALDAAALKTVLLGNTLTSTYAVAGSISTLFLDVNSGLLTFGAYTQTLTGGLNGTQLAAWSLNEQIADLHLGTDQMRVDFVGLSAALATVDTETFMNTIALVFENLATRIQGVIGDITTERITVREAALQIINPTVMGKAQIQAGIAGINTALPGNASSAASLSALANANAIKASADAALTAAKIAASAAESTMLSNQASYDAMVAVGNSNTASLAAAKAELARLQSWVNVAHDYGGEGDGGPGFISQRVGSDSQISAANAAVAAAIAAPNGSIASALGILSSSGAAMIAAQYGMASASAKVAAASAGQDSAVKAAAAAQLLYVAALQNFAIDASKSVGKLGKLREETVKYYEAQKQLADLMGSSAAGLRTTVADYRYSQLSDAQQFDKLQAEFAKNYAMGLSTDGETLAGYGDKLNAGLTPLLEKAREILSGSAYNSFSATALARAETIAGRLESLTPTNYAADSLMMLGNIDATLAALDASSQSAEKIISDAINAGSDKTAAGLRAIVQQLGGSPAFAGGGAHAGGGRWVGENGPEFEVTGPSHIYNAQQLRRLGSGSGGNADVVAELRALRQDNASIRIELRALVSSNARLARLAERAEIDGQLVRTDADTPLTTVVV